MKIACLFFSCVFIQWLSPAALARRQAPIDPASSDSWRQILQGKKAGNWTSVLEQLEALQQSDPESYRLRQADFLAATALEKLNRYREASQILGRFLKENPILRPLVLRRLFELSREQRHNEEALQWLQQYKADSSALVDLDWADWQRAQLLQTTDPRRAQRLYQSLVRRRSRFRRSAQLRWSDLEINPARQKSLRERLISERANDEDAYQAAKKLAKNLPALREGQIAAVANVLMLNRDLTEVRRVAQYFVDHFTRSPRLSFFHFLLGRTWMLDGQFPKAIREFDANYERFPADQWAIQSRYYTGHVYLRMERYREAAAVYQQIIETHLDSEWLGGAYVNQVGALRSTGQSREAIQIAQEGTERLKTFHKAELYYIQAKIVMSDSPAAAANLFLQSLQAGEQVGFPPGLEKAELHYWIGRCNEQLQDWTAAAAAYLESALQDTGYFAFLSRDSLRNLHSAHAEVRNWSDGFLSEAKEAKAAKKIEEYRNALWKRYYTAPEKEANVARAELLVHLAQDAAWETLNSLHLWPAEQINDAVLGQVSGSEHRRVAAVLAALGFFQEAAEILSKARDFASKLQQTWTVATYYGHADHWGEALAEAKALAVHLPFPTPELMPPRLVVFFLPLPFSTRTAEIASMAEPELVAALILQESRFQPDAKSAAGARGLMQLLSSTAEELAHEIGLPTPSLEDLYDSALSVKLGTAYLNKLFQRLKYPEMVVAAYNGGSDNVLRWRKTTEAFEAASFVADIGFPETKSYVVRVMGNYRLYKIVYNQS
ncbi:MAG: transglycosylase SLT domain-containing protein [Acidobacteria bacterium]|nr:transglycosylase SLT domain-containing protein [Acidobacteriota bacterium]